MNNRDDKFEGHEESEYHFSDEEVSYELEPEPEASKQAPSSSPSGGSKSNLIGKLAENRRALIAGGAIFALIIVLYEFLSPSSKPATEITPIAQNTSQAPANYITATTNQPVPSAQQPAAAAPSALAQAQAPAAPAAAAPQAPAIPAQASAAPVAPPAMMGNQPITMAQAQPQQQLVYPAAPAAQQPAAAPIVTVEAAPYQPAAAPTFGAPQMPAGVEPAMNNLNNQANAAINQLQSEYDQRLRDFANQNRALQDQVQTLNSRISTLETQLSQITNALTHENQNQAVPRAPGTSFNAAPGVQNQAAELKSSYNVQAIIPGRAWLRAENGETVTVTEGDMIKDLGRVSKIDPYDGVVEVNTGTKMISLAYGNGG